MASHSAGIPTPNATTGLAGDQPGALPYLSGDPANADLPVDENGDPVPLLFMSDGSGTGDDGDLVVAAPDGQGGVSVTLAADISGGISIGIGDGTGLL